MPSRLRTRLEKLERNKPARIWRPAMVFYDPATPGSMERKRLDVYEQAWRAGWRPGSSSVLAYFLPENHRPHPGRT